MTTAVSTDKPRRKEIEIAIAAECVRGPFKGLENDDGAAVRHSLKQMSDEWLVLAAKDGNTNAFAELRDRHSSKILRTTYRITRNWEDAEDALQGSFLKTFLHLNKFEGRSSFSSWATTIVINSLLMIVRMERQKKELSIDRRDNDCESNDRGAAGPCGIS